MTKEISHPTGGLQNKENISNLQSKENKQRYYTISQLAELGGRYELKSRADFWPVTHTPYSARVV